MSTYVRKAFSILGGLVRVNLSERGVGWSVGLLGLRLGFTPAGGVYLHLGRFGLYSRVWLRRPQRRRRNDETA